MEEANQDNFSNDEDVNMFQIQPVDLDNEKGLAKALCSINRLATNDVIKSVKKNEKPKVIKKLFNKFKSGNISRVDLAKLKEAFYEDADYQSEKIHFDSIYNELPNEWYKKNNGKVNEAKKSLDAEIQAASIVLLDKQNLIANIINDKDSLNKIIRFSKSLGKKSKVINNKKIVEVENDGIEEIEIDKVDETLEALLNDSGNKINVLKFNNPNIRISNKDKKDEVQDREGNMDGDSNKRKELAEFFRKKKQEKFKKMFELIDLTNENLSKLKNDVSTFNQAKWDNSSNAINKRLTDISTILLDIVNYIDAFNSQWVNFAKFGPSGRFKINQKIARPEKNKNQKIPDEQYKKLSAYEKFSNSWNFNDFKQNVPKSWFNQFNEQEKKDFLEKRLDYQKKRITELASKLKSNPEEKDLNNKIDTFLFYRNRDRYGFWLNTNEDQSKWDNDSVTLLDALNKHIDECSQKRLIFNKFRFGDKFLYSNGLSSEERLKNFKDKNYEKRKIVKYQNSYFNNNNFNKKIAKIIGQKRINSNDLENDDDPQSNFFKNFVYNNPSKKKNF